LRTAFVFERALSVNEPAGLCSRRRWKVRSSGQATALVMSCIEAPRREHTDLEGLAV
jgi:hypothetical protein